MSAPSTDGVATESQEGGGGALRQYVTAAAEAYRYMRMSMRRYLLTILVPAIEFAAVTVAVAVVLSPPLQVSAPLVTLGVLTFLVALTYPVFTQARRRKEIRNKFHLFITHLTVLSMTNIERVEMFRSLADVDEYGTLAEEMRFLVANIDTWNQSLEDATRHRANQVSSPLLSDFLERLSFVVGGGQPVSEFLVDEQDTIMQEFVTRYESDLERLDVMKELFMSLRMSMVFVVVFALLIPFLVGTDPQLIVFGSLGMYLLAQAGFVFALHNASPTDPVWMVADGLKRRPVLLVLRLLIVGVTLTIAALFTVVGMYAGVVPVDPGVLPVQLWVALSVTPLLVPGFVMRRREERVKARDDEFPSFLRAVGAVESVKQTSTADVLETLRHKDFGNLTEDVDALYKRLSMRIDPERAWYLFSFEAGSYLIQAFSDMYINGRRMGGDPKAIGQVISHNLTHVLNLRKQREQKTKTIIGVSYGLMAAGAFAFFTGLGVVEVLVAVTDKLSTSGDMLTSFLNPQVYDIDLIRTGLLSVLTIDALFSAALIRIADRGHPVSGLVHFVMLVWVGMVTAVLTDQVLEVVISV